MEEELWNDDVSRPKSDDGNERGTKEILDLGTDLRGEGEKKSRGTPNLRRKQRGRERSLYEITGIR